MIPTSSSLRHLRLRVLAAGVVLLGLPAELRAEPGHAVASTVQDPTPGSDPGASLDGGLPFDRGPDAHPRPILGAEATGGAVEADVPVDRGVVADGSAPTSPSGVPRGSPNGAAPGGVALRIHLRRCGHFSHRLDLPPPLPS